MGILLCKENIQFTNVRGRSLKYRVHEIQLRVEGKLWAFKYCPNNLSDLIKRRLLIEISIQEQNQYHYEKMSEILAGQL